MLSRTLLATEIAFSDLSRESNCVENPGNGKRSTPVTGGAARL